MKYQTIISVADLAKTIETAKCLILDCRGGVFYDSEKYEVFLKSHIPKAFYFCYATESLTNSDIDRRSSFITSNDKNQVIENIEALGFDKHSQIIIYDDNETASEFSNSVWLFLRSIGYLNVAVLQGGIISWINQDMPVDKISNSMGRIFDTALNKRPNFH